MNPILLAQILQYLALAPQAIPIVVGVINEVKEIIANGGKVDQAKIDELVAKAQANHDALPKPE